MAEYARGTQHPEENAMRRIGLYFLILTALSLNFMPSSRAQEKPAGKVQVMGLCPSRTKSGPRAESLEAVAYYEQHYTCLAETMPAEKYGWRPGQGSAPLVKSLPTSPLRITASRTL